VDPTRGFDRWAAAQGPTRRDIAPATTTNPRGAFFCGGWISGAAPESLLEKQRLIEAQGHAGGAARPISASLGTDDCRVVPVAEHVRRGITGETFVK